jgi:hypothetical protein
MEETTLVLTDQAQVIISIDELSKSHAQSIERLTKEIKERRQMLLDGLSNSVEYKEIDEKVKAAQKERLKVKARYMEIPSNRKIEDEVKSMKSEKKEKQLALSDYLLELERMTGANQLELFDGSVYEIVKTAKLIRKRV